MSNPEHTYDASDIHYIAECEVCQEQLRRIAEQHEPEPED